MFFVLYTIHEFQSFVCLFYIQSTILNPLCVFCFIYNPRVSKLCKRSLFAWLGNVKLIISSDDSGSFHLIGSKSLKLNSLCIRTKYPTSQCTYQVVDIDSSFTKQRSKLLNNLFQLLIFYPNSVCG